MTPAPLNPAILERLDALRAQRRQDALALRRLYKPKLPPEN